MLGALPAGQHRDGPVDGRPGARLIRAAVAVVEVVALVSS